MYQIAFMIILTSGIGKEYAEANKQVCTDVDECAVQNGDCGDHVICENTEGNEQS